MGYQLTPRLVRKVLRRYDVTLGPIVDPEAWGSLDLGEAKAEENLYKIINDIVGVDLSGFADCSHVPSGRYGVLGIQLNPQGGRDIEHYRKDPKASGYRRVHITGMLNWHVASGDFNFRGEPFDLEMRFDSNAGHNFEHIQAEQHHDLIERSRVAVLTYTINNSKMPAARMMRKWLLYQDLFGSGEVLNI